MHPNSVSDWTDRGEMLAFVAERGFAHIFVAGADGLIDLPLAKQPGTGGEKMQVDEGETGLPSRTRYRLIEPVRNASAPPYLASPTIG